MRQKHKSSVNREISISYINAYITFKKISLITQKKNMIFDLFIQINLWISMEFKILF